jgi:hypothetical protein
MASIPRRVTSTFRATRVTSAGSGVPAASHGGSGPSSVTPMWPGITERDSRCECSWAWKGGVMQVKVVSAACPVAAHRRAA